MKISLFSLLLVVAIPAMAQELTDDQIQKAYQQAAQEQKRYMTAGHAGGAVGGVVGAGAGFFGSAKLAKKAGVKIEADKPNKLFGKNIPAATPLALGIAYAGLGAGAYAGAKLGKTVGASAVTLYYARKYGVSEMIAHVALITMQPLSIPSIKEIFIKATKKDDAALNLFLARFYEQEFGKNWHHDIRKIVKDMTHLIELHGNYQAEKIAEKHKVLEKFNDSAWFTWGLSVLYFNKNIYLADRDLKARIAATDRLLRTLGIIE